NPQPPPSRYTPAQTLPAPNPQSKSRLYSSPTSPPTASAAHHLPLHSAHSSTKPFFPGSPFASFLAQAKTPENVCTTILVSQSPRQSPSPPRCATNLSVHAVRVSKFQKNSASAA